MDCSNSNLCSKRSELVLIAIITDNCNKKIKYKITFLIGMITIFNVMSGRGWADLQNHLEMKIAFIALVSSMLLCEGKKMVKFLLPTDEKSSDSSLSLTSLTSESSQSESSSSVSSAAEDLEFARIDLKESDGKFGTLRKDDDFIGLRRSKRKRSSKKNKQRKRRSVKTTLASVKGGKQSVGFVYNRAWYKEAEAKFEKSMTNGKRNDMKFELNEGIVKEPVNAGWWLFSFDGKKSSVARTQFQFKTSLPVRVTLVDLLCRGDSFGVWDGGKLIAQSSRIRADEECEEVMFAPQEALADGRWSSVVFELEQGEHSIELRTIDTVFSEKGSGVGAIKFEHILLGGRRVSRNKVCRGYNGLIVINAPVEAHEAKSVCVSLKTELARVNVEDEAVSRSIKTCAGNEGKVWALERDDDAVRMVALKGESVKLEMGNGDEFRPVLCRVRS